MLYALGRPLSLAVLLVSFVVGIVLHHAVQAFLAARFGDPRPRQEGRISLNPRVHLDPFGAVGALIGGLGWGRQVEFSPRLRRGQLWLLALSGPLVNVALGAGLLLAAAAVSPQGLFAGVGEVGASVYLRKGLPTEVDPLGVALLLAGASQLYLGALSLVPIPPLEGGRLMLALAPRTQGWQKAQHYLVDQNIGTVVLLVLMVIPLAGDLLLHFLLDELLAPLMSVILGV